MTGWEPLATADPVPGDPSVSAEAGAYYADIAQAMADAHAALGIIQDMDGFESEAVEALRGKAQDVRDVVRKAEERYAAAGEALGAYATKHREARDAATALLVRAREAQAQVDSDERALASARDSFDEATRTARTVGEPVDDAARHAVSTADAALTTSQAALDARVAELPTIVEAWRAAARAAKGTISEAVEADELNDGWWEHWGSKVATVVSAWAGNIATWAGIASLLLGWVPILGQILTVVTVVATVAALVADLALAAHGEGSWLDVGLGILGVVTFGLGRIVGGAGRGLAGQALARGGSRAERLIARSSRLGSPRNVVAARTAWSSASRGFRSLPVQWYNPVSWFRSGIASFSGLSGRAKLMNFLGHGEAARAYQTLRNADAVPAFARNATAYVETMRHLSTIKPWPVGSLGSALVPYSLDVAGTITNVTKKVTS